MMLSLMIVCLTQTLKISAIRASGQILAASQAGYLQIINDHQIEFVEWHNNVPLESKVCRGEPIDSGLQGTLAFHNLGTVSLFSCEDSRFRAIELQVPTGEIVASVDSGVIVLNEGRYSLVTVDGKVRLPKTPLLDKPSTESRFSQIGDNLYLLATDLSWPITATFMLSKGVWVKVLSEPTSDGRGTTFEPAFEAKGMVFGTVFPGESYYLRHSVSDLASLYPAMQVRGEVNRLSGPAGARPFQASAQFLYGCSTPDSPESEKKVSSTPMSIWRWNLVGLDRYDELTLGLPNNQIPKRIIPIPNSDQFVVVAKDRIGGSTSYWHVGT
ncbi:MAG: hypothetical protein JSS71_12775 [Armatimonadetes bacterium]|nr:hypothetical protein [Armatimonadota bacterium]MBX3110168.1 hypothetical protein [Fimbriimonadaceae bacterium]